jgi:glycosyltransferase involved in cell wall biosynthesis
VNVLYYIPKISKAQGGIYQYSKRVLNALVETEHEIFIWNENSDFDEFDNLSGVSVVRSNFGIIDRIRYKFTRVLKSLSGEFSALKGIELYSPDKKLCRKYKIDLVHSPHQGIPIYSVPFIFTLHDVQELHFPEYFSSLEREVRARNNRLACEAAKGVIVSYTHVKNDLIKFFGLNQSNIHTLFIGTSDNSLMPRINTPQLESSESPFILYPAATWPHKNHINLLKAFRLVLNKDERVKLVCTGHKTEYFEQISSTLNELRLEESVEYLGVVSNARLKELYQNCLGVVVPTKYEAGSFPLMEAIAQEIPVVCSNVTSLPDTIQNPNFVFDPDNIEEMASLMMKLISDQNFISENIENSRKLRSSIVDQPLTVKLGEIVTKAFS